LRKKEEVEMKKANNNSISRRETLRLIGAAGATAFVGNLWSAKRRGSVINASPLSPILAQQTCVVKPQLTEGPYFVDEKLNRSDVRTDPTDGAIKAGSLLVLTINVTRLNSGICTPLTGAYVDIWHCDALGIYSDVSDPSFNTKGQKFLRGYQVTDGNGSVQFKTIYPGWYSGRAVHIHFKIRQFTGSQTAYEFTSQLFFNDSFTDQVYTQPPYNTKGARNTRNNQDGIYNGGGSQLLLNVSQSSEGYAATFDIALQGITAINPAPVILGAAVSGKQLMVAGQNFDNGAALLMNGEQQSKTSNDPTSPTTLLIARKSGKKISPGESVTLQVVNSDGTRSNELMFTRPA